MIIMKMKTGKTKQPQYNLSKVNMKRIDILDKAYFLITRIRFLWGFHCLKSVRIRSISGPYFPAFGLNTEIYGVFSPNVGK